MPFGTAPSLNNLITFLKILSCIGALSTNIRIRSFLVSRINTLPLVSTHSPLGSFKEARIAGPPSPPKPAVPFPAIVAMIPVPAFTTRMRLFSLSAMNKLPLLSTATPDGDLNNAFVAGPPSPLKPSAPVPATVVITPVPAATRRMRWLDLSAMNRFPLASSATPLG